MDFDSLKQKNPDTIAWLKVNGTDIEYPVVKTTNNDFYMTHSFDKSYNSAGWVFMDYKDRFDGKDNNMVIYGHNRRDGSMFGTDNEFQTFINKIKSRSVKDFNVKVTTEDHILTLSTCADNNKYRVVLHAKKIVE